MIDVESHEGKSELTLTLGNGNVFADLGFPEPRTHMLKAKLVTHLREIVGSDDQARASTAAIIGLDPAGLARVFKGQFHDVSMERLIALTEGLGYEVELVITIGQRRQSLKEAAQKAST